MRSTTPLRSALLLVALLVFVSWSHAADERSPADQPQVRVPVDVHDFGTVARGDSLTHTFVVENAGKAPLELLDVHVACGCTTAGDWTRTIAPGESGRVPLRLETAQFTGPIVKTATVVTNDPQRPDIVLTLKASIWTAITLSQTILVVPPISDPDRPARGSITLRNQTDEPLVLRDLQSDNPNLKPELKELTPGQVYELVVTTVPPLAPTTHSATVRIKTSLSKQPEITVPVVATVLPAVQVAPAEFAFPEERLPESQRRFAVLLSQRGAPLSVSDLTTNAPGVTVSAKPSEDGKRVTITVEFPAGFETKRENQFIRGKTSLDALPEFQIPIIYAGE